MVQVDHVAVDSYDSLASKAMFHLAFSMLFCTHPMSAVCGWPDDGSIYLGACHKLVSLLPYCWCNLQHDTFSHVNSHDMHNKHHHVH